LSREEECLNLVLVLVLAGMQIEEENILIVAVLKLALSPHVFPAVLGKFCLSANAFYSLSRSGREGMVRQLI